MTSLGRRRFLGLAGAAAGAAAAGPVLWARLVDEQVQRNGEASAPSRPSRLLVVLELAGGNDGLNTLVPADGRYRDARPTLGIPERDLIALRGEPGYALHPALAPIEPFWAAGELAVIDGVGFGGQTRSHFAATDVWRAGGIWPFTSSWLGRWLDATRGEQAEPLRAIALGTNSLVLKAEQSVSTVVTRPESFLLNTPDVADARSVVEAFRATSRPVSDDPTFAAVQQSIPTTLEAIDVLAAAAPTGARTQETRETRLSSLLATAARIVELDVGTQVIVVGADGYDTHGNQAEMQHALLADLATGIAHFRSEMARLGRDQDVLIVTTSEFGRRVAENGSAGTDHGNGGLALLTGAGVAGQIVGAPDLVHLVEGDLPVDIETRSLYANALDWLGGPTDEILDGTFDRYDLVSR
jgi:uncharacterized protein (DUF1501 family)